MTKKLTYESFKSKLLTEGYLVSHSDEEKYLRDNGLILRRLSNGAHIVIAQKKEPDARFASINFNFSTGSYFDPKGKRGAHHFLEHLFISSKLSVFLNNHYIDHNAYTSQTKVVVYNSGIYNAEFPDVGVLKGLAWTIQNIIRPEGLYNKDSFEYERNVILKEIAERSGDHKTLTFDKLYQTLLEDENPYALSAIGTTESVNAVTQEDMEEIMQQRIGTNNLTVSVIAAGKGDEAESLVKVLEKEVDTFPRKGVKTEINLNMYSKMKPLDRDNPISVKLPISNKIASIFLIWMIDAEAFSEDVIGFNFLIPYIRNILFNAARDEGLGYTIDFFNSHFLPNTMMIGAFLITPSQDVEQSIEKFKALIKTILAKVKQNEAELTELLAIEKNSQKASPISQKGKLNQSLATLTDFGLLTNSQVAREIYLSVTTELLKKLITSLENTKPATIIIGDLA